MIGSYSENGRYFVFAGNLTYCTPDTIAGKVVKANPETAVDTITDTLIGLRQQVENHPDDKYCGWVFPEVYQGKSCTFESAREEFEAYRDFKVMRARTYSNIQRRNENE